MRLWKLLLAAALAAAAVPPPSGQAAATVSLTFVGTLSVPCAHFLQWSSVGPPTTSFVCQPYWFGLRATLDGAALVDGGTDPEQIHADLDYLECGDLGLGVWGSGPLSYETASGPDTLWLSITGYTGLNLVILASGRNVFGHGSTTFGLVAPEDDRTAVMCGSTSGVYLGIETITAPIEFTLAGLA